MELAIVPVDSSFRDNQTLYEEWFNYADSGCYLNKIFHFSSHSMMIEIHMVLLVFSCFYSYTFLGFGFIINLQK